MPIRTQDELDFSRVLGGHIKDARIARGLTQEHVARLASLRVDVLRNYEQGRSIMTPLALYRLSLVLKLSPSKLLGDTHDDI